MLRVMVVVTGQLLILGILGGGVALAVDKARIVVYAGERVGEIDSNIYGHFIEHLGRCIYGGVWGGEEAKVATVGGLRVDVLELVKAIKPPVIRWPGGCFADGYHWQDGVGPPDRRPSVFDRAWKNTDSNRFGTDEFIEFCQEVGAEPYICCNFGSGTPEEAAGWVEYCNGGVGTEWGAKRAANGHPGPYGVKYWGIGNEICLSGEIGHVDATTYGERFIKFAEAMKKVDLDIKLIGVGWHSDIPDWNGRVLEIAGDYMDYLSIHHYVSAVGEPVPAEEQLYKAIAAAPLDIERKLRWTEGVIKQCGKEVAIAFDEWNVWLPHFEHSYRLRDGIFAVGVFHVLHRVCNTVKMANLAQLVNVLGAIYTTDTDVVVTPIYVAFELYVNHSGEVVLRSEVECGSFDVVQTGNVPALEDVPYLDVSATMSRDGRKLYLAVINRHADEDIEATISLKGFEAQAKAMVYEMNGPGVEASNEFGKAALVGVVEREFVGVGLSFSYFFPSHSVSVLELERK